MPTPTVIYKAETDLETDCWPPPRANQLRARLPRRQRLGAT